MQSIPIDRNRKVTDNNNVSEVFLGLGNSGAGELITEKKNGDLHSGGGGQVVGLLLSQNVTFSG
jgi:hypothetical protein